MNREEVLKGPTWDHKRGKQQKPVLCVLAQGLQMLTHEDLERRQKVRAETNSGGQGDLTLNSSRMKEIKIDKSS